MKIEIKHIYCGKSKKINDGKKEIYASSYQKEDLNKTTYELNEHGFKLDSQSDLESHGGRDKAVCVYSLDSHKYLEEKYDISLPNCAFGQNLSIVGIDDSQVCIGDRFSCGEVIFEVSQPRQPCWIISSITGTKKLTALIVKEYKTGFYLRVLQSGSIKPSDTMELLSREYPKFTIEFVNKSAYNAKKNQENLKEIIACEKLASVYRTDLEKRYKDKEVGLQEWQRDEYVKE